MTIEGRQARGTAALAEYERKQAALREAKSDQIALAERLEKFADFRRREQRLNTTVGRFLEAEREAGR